MTGDKVFTEASTVESKAGSVHITGPDSVDISMTPEAAARTGADLIEKAAEAIGKEAINVDALKRGTIAPYCS